MSGLLLKVLLEAAHGACRQDNSGYITVVCLAADEATEGVGPQRCTLGHLAAEACLQVCSIPVMVSTQSNMMQTANAGCPELPITASDA